MKFFGNQFDCENTQENTENHLFLPYLIFHYQKKSVYYLVTQYGRICTVDFYAAPVLPTLAQVQVVCLPNAFSLYAELD